MNNVLFFKKNSQKYMAGGPSHEEQLSAILQNNYWTVLNAGLLKLAGSDETLNNKANALKHSLQTYGPNSKNLPSLRQNEGKAKGEVFHGHVHNSQGLEYVIEWAIVDKNKKIMAITNFDKHENFKFKQAPLNDKEIKIIQTDVKNIKIMDRVACSTSEIKKKFVQLPDVNTVQLKKHL